ncbi:hypothetical protein Y032_0044g1077 [Ancylostoma ceylanicum]|uniref:Uncharacterized protein n=1 Tax=Ancylostoma ceylanicum TaxID=53326 RepID=A0A016UF78_9BILA|nr:hypothetical protein Y032_0044g1077 [Ancylostoma ceylanicum]
MQQVKVMRCAQSVLEDRVSWRRILKSPWSEWSLAATVSWLVALDLARKIWPEVSSCWHFRGRVPQSRAGFILSYDS